jgi:cytochrome c oxidase subunit II
MTNPWMPPIASAHGARIDASLAWVHWLMAILFVGWILFFLYCLWRFRAARHPVADHAGVQSHASSWLEGGVALAEAILLIGLSIPLWAERVAKFPTSKDTLVVRVTGEQFAWNVHYPGPDGVFGRTAIDKIDVQTNPLGIDRSDPAAKDDVTTVNQLRLPVDRPVIVHLTSKDVIHSFGLYEMRVKQDAIPGLSIPVWFIPTVTTADMRQKVGKADFEYEIACSQLCGLGHFRMRGYIHVLTADAYQKWMAEQVQALRPPG